jgi:hypothetical protein
MDEDTQKEINRRNAAKSTGPRTVAGKARSSMNAMKHGLLSRRLLLPTEDAEVADQLLAGLWACFAPVGCLEEELVRKLHAATVRLRRADVVELGLWERDRVSTGKPSLARVFFEDARNSQSIEKLCRYVSAHDKDFYKALEALRETQKDRFKREAEADTTDVDDPDGGLDLPRFDDAEDLAVGGAGPDSSHPVGDTVEEVPVSDQECGSARPVSEQKAIEASTPMAQRAHENDGDAAHVLGSGSDERTATGQGVDTMPGPAGTDSIDELIERVAANPHELDDLSPLELLRLRAKVQASLSNETSPIEKPTGGVVSAKRVEGGAGSEPTCGGLNCETKPMSPEQPGDYPLPEPEGPE